MLRSRVHAPVHKLEIEGVGIIVSLHQACYVETRLPLVRAAFSQAPAQFYAVALGNNPAFARLPAAGSVHIPLVSQALEGLPVFRYGETAHGHGPQVPHGNVELRAGTAGLRIPGLRYPGAAILLHLYPDIQIGNGTDGLCLCMQQDAQ